MFEEQELRTLLEKSRIHLGLLLTVAVSLPILLHFFEYFPNGWDQTEYSWCIQSDYLPHSPYILFFILGKFFHLFLAPPVALATLSLFSGLASLGLFYFVNYRLFSPHFQEQKSAFAAWSLPTMATMLVGWSYLFIRQGSSQDTYVTLTFMVLLAISFLLTRIRGKAVYSGLVFGCALAIHNGALFILPVMVYTLLTVEQERRVRSLRHWLLAVAITCAFFCFLIYLILPVSPGGNHWREYIAYLRGISPGLELRELLKPQFWANSIKALFPRLLSLEIPSTRWPAATSPVGFSLLYLLVAAIGLAISFGRYFRQALLWLLWAAPYLLYEVALDLNLDYGIYLPFLLPPLAVFATIAILSLVGYRGSRISRYISITVRGLLVFLLLLPSGALIVRHWDDPVKDAVAHFSPSTLAAIWASRHLPTAALVIQSRAEWNVNILPYYARRQHVLWTGQELVLFQDIGRYTPMNIHSYTLLTTAMLKGIIASGRPVYAFESNPLKDCDPAILDGKAFTWEAGAVADLDAVESLLTVPQSVRDQLPRGTITLYQGRLK